VDDVFQSMLYEGVSVEIAFPEPRPSFGDLFLICGESHPRFQPTGHLGFEALADLQFEQVDDYFGVRSLSEEGEGVVVWLYPLVGPEPVDHHAGPFDGIRLSFNVLRNPSRRGIYFLKCVERFAALGHEVHYRSRNVPLGNPPLLAVVREDLESITRHWASEGIVVGSQEALEIDF